MCKKVLLLKRKKIQSIILAMKESRKDQVTGMPEQDRRQDY